MKPMSIKSAAVAFTALLCIAASFALISQSVAATPSTAPNVTYSATGTFTTPQVSGADNFKLAGQAFTISLVANEATVPTSHGARWAKYTKLSMSGAVNSGLFPTPFAISSSACSLELATGNPSYDVFALFAPINVLGKPIYLTTALQLPTGTMTNALIKPFNAPATLGPTSGSVTYSDPSTGAATVLTIASGTLSTTVSSAPTTH
jgi:hypothetical protein